MSALSVPVRTHALAKGGLMYDIVQCKKCRKLHLSLEAFGQIYYHCGEEKLTETIIEYKERISRGDD